MLLKIVTLNRTFDKWDLSLRFFCLSDKEKLSSELLNLSICQRFQKNMDLIFSPFNLFSEICHHFVVIDTKWFITEYLLCFVP